MSSKHAPATQALLAGSLLVTLLTGVLASRSEFDVRSLFILVLLYFAGFVFQNWLFGDRHWGAEKAPPLADGKEDGIYFAGELVATRNTVEAENQVLEEVLHPLRQVGIRVGFGVVIVIFFLAKWIWRFDFSFGDIFHVVAAMTLVSAMGPSHFFLPLLLNAIAVLLNLKSGLSAGAGGFAIPYLASLFTLFVFYRVFELERMSGPGRSREPHLLARRGILSAFKYAAMFLAIVLVANVVLPSESSESSVLHWLAEHLNKVSRVAFENAPLTMRETGGNGGKGEAPAGGQAVAQNVRSADAKKAGSVTPADSPGTGAMSAKPDQATTLTSPARPQSVPALNSLPNLSKIQVPDSKTGASEDAAASGADTSQLEPNGTISKGSARDIDRQKETLRRLGQSLVEKQAAAVGPSGASAPSLEAGQERDLAQPRNMATSGSGALDQVAAQKIQDESQSASGSLAGASGAISELNTEAVSRDVAFPPEPVKPGPPAVSEATLKHLLLFAALLAVLLFLSRLSLRVAKEKAKRVKLSREKRRYLRLELAQIEARKLEMREEVLARYQFFLRVLEAVQIRKEDYLPADDFHWRVRELHPPIQSESELIMNTFNDTCYGNFPVSAAMLKNYRQALDGVVRYFGF